MLCKTTMRAALAPVIGLFGMLFATTVGAQMDLTGDKAPTALAYASESLHDDHSDTIAKVKFYRLNATGAELVIAATIPIALPGSGGPYYLRYDFDGEAGLTRNLVEGDLDANFVADGTPEPAESVPAGGRTGDDFVVFELTHDAGVTRARDSVVRLDLSLTSTERSDHDEDGNTPDIYAMNWLAVAPRGAINIDVRASVYNDYFDAVNSNGSIFTTPKRAVVSFKRAVKGSIVSKHDIADVSTAVADGGPFRRFIDDADRGGPTSGVLGMTTVSVDKTLRDAGAKQGTKAGGSGMITDDIVDSTGVVVTSEAGNFAVSLAEGGTVNKKAGKGKPWMLAKEAGCTSGPLTLSGADGAMLDMYATDPDGADGPLVKGDLTPAGIRAATRATGSAAAEVGMNYFCVLVTGNTEPIPEIGDPMDPKSYDLTITPVFDDGKDRPVKGMAVNKMVGAIDRNGTTVNVTYLTTNPFVDQRLVIVNRSGDSVAFWVDGFNLEDGTTVPSAGNKLALGEGQMVPANGRRVVTVSNVIEFDGQTRGSATVNVAAPTRDIDVMTVQRSPFTDEVDTTLYAPE